MIYSCLRRMLFALPPELAHDLTLGGLAYASRRRALCRLLRKLNRARVAALPRQVMGLTFPNPVGLAAGLDKHGVAGNALHALGFGWLEIGTVMSLPQPGNAKPRLFRLRLDADSDSASPAAPALINRMGFNSVGLAAVLNNIARSYAAAGIIKGINIGTNARTEMRAAVQDYVIGLQAVYAHADYVAINISSPNTPNLRDLQQPHALDQLLRALHRKRTELADRHGRRMPIVLKISPDITAQEVNHIAELARKHQLDGVAATNTTVLRNGVESHPLAAQSGGLSGAPLAARATEVVALLYCNLQGEIPIIGCGGIDCAQRAVEKFQAGAELVQIYTGFLYHGPKLIRDIVERMRLAADPCPTPDDLNLKQ